MGTRVNVFIGESRAKAGAVLYANTHHPNVDIEQIVRDAVTDAVGPTSLVKGLLDKTYPSDHLDHKEGDNIFSIDLEPYDHEFVLIVNEEMNIRKADPSY